MQIRSDFRLAVPPDCREKKTERSRVGHVFVAEEAEDLPAIRPPIWACLTVFSVGFPWHGVLAD